MNKKRFLTALLLGLMVLVLNSGEEPDRILLTDFPIQASIMLWLVSYFAITYSGMSLFR